MIYTAPLFMFAVCVTFVAIIWRGNSHNRQPKPRKWWMKWVEYIPGINERQPAKIDPKTGKPYPKWVRGAIIMSALSAAFLVLGFVPWQDALVVWTYRGWGPGLLVIALLGLGGVLWLEVRHLHHYQLGATTVTAAVFGTVAMTAWVLKGRLAHKGSQILPGITSSMNDYSKRATSGAAIRAYRHSATVAGVPWIAVAGFVALGVVLILILNLHRGVPKAARKLKELGEQSELAVASAQRALPGGTGNGTSAPVRSPRPASRGSETGGLY